MVDFTYSEILQTFLQTNLVIIPDGVKRPLVLLSDESDNDDAEGSLDSGTIRIIEETLNTFWNNSSHEDQVIQFDLTFEYSITASTTKANFINVLEDIKQQANENNNGATPPYYLEVRYRQFPSTRHAYAEIVITMSKFFVVTS